MNYTPTIGLELHAELKTKSKMFCSCANNPLEQRPNVNICPICMGHPGTLPVANEEAIRKTIKVGLAFDCEIAEKSKFDRKNYFYPDLPKGYQISQYDAPFCKNGHLKVKERDIRITRVHLEEDTGRLVHGKEGSGMPTHEEIQGFDSVQLVEKYKKDEYSLVDFNRAGVPLLELVTEPDIQLASEAKQFAQELQLILRYVGASDADMEKGQMRVEANVSVRPEGQAQLGTKVEVKNLNSFRAVERAIEYEIKRQTEVLESGGKIVQETRGWDDGKGETFVQREKESAHEYRYFPEPDIPPFEFSKEEIKAIRAELPELPQARRERFEKEYGLVEKTLEVLVVNKDLGEYFEQGISELGEHISHEKMERLIKLSSNYLVSDLQGLLGGMSVEDKKFLITPENFAELMDMIADEKISTPVAKSVLKEMFETGADPHHIVEEKGLSQLSNTQELQNIVQKVIAENPKPVEDYKNGKMNALQFLAGKIMAETRGKANPQIIQDLLGQALDKV